MPTISHSMDLNKILGVAQDLSDEIHELTNGREYPNKLGLALLQQSQDICDAIRILLEANLPGPAYALARPMRDAYVRGLWLLNHASDMEIEEFRKGEEQPGFGNLLKAIGNDEETGGAWIHKICEFNRQAFHDLTHGGIEHVERRTTIDSTEPNYPEDEQIRLMHVQIGIQFDLVK
ncbi:MAG: hypothetical protein ABL887_01335 [Nitrosomonas sp.]